MLPLEYDLSCCSEDHFGLLWRLGTGTFSLILSSYPPPCFNPHPPTSLTGLMCPSLSILSSLVTFPLLHCQSLCFSQKVKSWWCGCEWQPDFGTSNKERHRPAKYEEGVSSCKARCSENEPWYKLWDWLAGSYTTWTRHTKGWKRPWTSPTLIEFWEGEVCVFLLPILRNHCLVLLDCCQMGSYL